MPVEINDLQKLNQQVIDALEKQADKLRDLKDGLPLDQRVSVLATISDLDTRIRAFEFTREHLAAAEVVVRFDSAEAQKLADLGAQLDVSIVQDAQLNAILDSLPAVMNAAVRIDALINGHIAQS